MSFSIVTPGRAILLASTILMTPGVAKAERNTAIDGNNGTLPLPTGQYVTPQAPSGALQQPLNPGLPAYPAFVAGMAVRSQLSPDGTLLAIICAGQNSLVSSTGAVGGVSTLTTEMLTVVGAEPSWEESTALYWKVSVPTKACAGE